MSCEMSKPVVLAEFSQRVEADLVHSVLEAAGIDAIVQSDDCGTVDPALAFGLGVKLIVDEASLTEAQEIMRVVQGSE